MSFDESQCGSAGFFKTVPIWADPESCPSCNSDQTYKINFGIDGWHGVCLDCDHTWVLAMTGDGS